MKYEVIENGTMRGGDFLISSDGHIYTVRRKNKKDTIVWLCTREQKMMCLATVRQRSGEQFLRNLIPHSHPPDMSAAVRIKFSIKVCN